MQINSIDQTKCSKTQFGMACYVDGNARAALLKRISTPGKYMKFDAYKQVLNRASLDVHLTAGQGVSPRRLQATIYDKSGRIGRYHEGFIESFIFSPSHFMKKLLKIAQKIDKKYKKMSY